MFYTKENKQLLGRYFRYIREDKNIKLTDIINLGICDYKTIKKIEEGQESKSNIFYDQLIDYYHINIEDINIILELFNSYNKDLYNAVEWYDTNQISNLLNKITTKINNKILKEYQSTLNLIKKFYIHNEYLSYDEIMSSLKLIKLWNNELSSILIEMCGKSNTNSLLDNNIIHSLKELCIYDDNLTLFRKADLCVNDINYDEALKLLNHLLIFYSNSNNKLRLLDVKMDIFNIYRDIDSEKASKYSFELIDLLNNNSIPIIKKKSILYNLGIYYYFRYDYENALNCFKQSFKFESKMKSLFFVYVCQSRLGKLHTIDYELDKNHYLYTYCNYFKLKSIGADYIQLENYICNQVIKELCKEKYEEPFWPIFRYELEEIIKVTKRYKNYYEFQQKFQNTMKTAD